ncbi:unnamed protein product [Linum trigynum]|uniref:F-box domain-containing protein n=1 Tax=Linum trigynum TaxID=586398 RepID=A0AAV2EN97_9ROSI
MEEAEEGRARKKSSRGGAHPCCSINDVLGDELLTEILLRLPLDHIFRGKSVCKLWRSLIQNPLFPSCYTKKKQSSTSSLSCHLKAHPQQRSPILIPITGSNQDKKKKKRLAFSLDFVPGFAQLYGSGKYHRLLRRAAADDENRKQQEKHPPGVYTTRDLILGSSNGLILCAPLLHTPNPRSKFDLEPVFDDFPPFMCGGNCWFKIVRLQLKSPRRRSLELQVFSSQSWEWTAVTVSSLPRPIGPDDDDSPLSSTVAVTLLSKKNDGPRLCWLLKGTQAIVYDPVKNVVDAVIGPTRRTVRISRTVPKVVILDAVCVSNGCLWGGRLRFWLTLEIYRASGGTEWEMVKEFDMMQIYRPGGREPVFATITWNTFLAMNPHDPELVYLKTQESVGLLDLRSGTLKVVGVLDNPEKNLLRESTIVCENPPWPTPLPSPPPHLSCP